MDSWAMGRICWRIGSLGVFGFISLAKGLGMRRGNCLMAASVFGSWVGFSFSSVSNSVGLVIASLRVFFQLSGCQLGADRSIMAVFL